MQLSSVTPPALPAAGTGPHRDVQARVVTEDLVGGAQGDVHTETLPNGVRIIVAERPGAASTKLQIGIGAGANQDPQGKLGLAHLLEHLAFEGSPTRSAETQERMRARLGGDWNAWTNQAQVVFYGVVPGAQATQGASLLTDMFRNPKLSGPQLEQELAAVKNEMVYWGGSARDEAGSVQEKLLFGEHPAVNNIIGSRKSVDRIEPSDLRAWHDQHFVGRNTVALVEGDPERLPLDTIRRELGKLAPGARVDNSGIEAPLVPGQALQVLNDPASSTVKLTLMLPVETETLAGLETPSSLLLTGLSDRLNSNLRRQGNLTYGVGAKILPGDATSVLEVTTNVAREHAQSAVERIVETLTDARDGFGPKTFATHKASVLAALRASEQGTPLTASERASIAFDDALASGGTDVLPADMGDDGVGEMRHALGRVTAADFARDAGSLIRFDDMKLLAEGALDDGGASLLKGLRDAGIETKGFAINPVDLTQLKDMGLRVTKDTTPPMQR